MILAVAQQGSGLAIIGTYSTCEYAMTTEVTLSIADFFSLAGLQDPFLGSLILS